MLTKSQRILHKRMTWAGTSSAEIALETRAASEKFLSSQAWISQSSTMFATATVRAQTEKCFYVSFLQSLRCNYWLWQDCKDCSKRDRPYLMCSECVFAGAQCKSISKYHKMRVVVQAFNWSFERSTSRLSWFPFCSKRLFKFLSLAYDLMNVWVSMFLTSFRWL